MYSFELEDYFTPAFVSFTKPYFGTDSDFKAMLDNIPGDGMEGLKEAYEHFTAGERKIMHYAGQIKTRFARPVELLLRKDFTFDRVQFSFENAYGFEYRIRFDKASGVVSLVKLGKKFLIVYRAKLERPRYCNSGFDARRYHPLGDMLWGHPGIIRTKGKSIENLLAVPESVFDDEQSARARFDDLSSFDWSYFFQDVFGDG